MPAQKLADRHSLKIFNMEPSIPPNNSHQQLMTAIEDSDSLESTAASSLVSIREDKMKPISGFRGISAGEWVTMAILCFINLINYMDRYTVAGVLTYIQDDMKISDDKAGLLQTAFVISYMVFAPIFGYLGDRYNRKWIMAAGILMWSLTTLIGSFMNTYATFITFRSLVGIGEASYSTIAPTIISDMFIKERRTKMLALFYFAIPVGSGLGYIVGAKMAQLLGGWQWGLRLTPILGVSSVLLLLLFLREPARGESEGTHGSVVHTSWLEDIRRLMTNKSFMLSTAGFTCVTFVTGALAFFGPKFLCKGFSLIPYNSVESDVVSFNFGAVAMASGLIGVPLGPFVAQLLRSRVQRIDPLVCGVGLLISTPICFAALVVASKSMVGCYLLILLGEIFLNLNWSIVADILLYVVPANRRSTAEAFQILFCHALGDASSPYIIGLVSESIQKMFHQSSVTDAKGHALSNDSIEFYSLQYALFITCFVEVFGGLLFLLTALYVNKDKETTQREMAALSLQEPTNYIANDPRER